ncbi:uncharacterized protein LOC128963372 [Oppia nitens]|uniref:uncharacterized protein LOC128963372 n=1 Tax=Oppia nitens TaxID=1686743 RepID=UPI0023DA0F29|nr:uncharacterized protein LOC128963372 [Oppia nitens]
MPIDIYYIKYSPPCRAVHMVAKQLNIDLNFKIVDLSEGEHLKEDFLKLNPFHTIPVIDDDGFVLWESRAILQYLCNQYTPDSTLYPKDPKKRAIVDRWLNFDLSFFNNFRDAVAKPKFMDQEPNEQSVKTMNDSLKLVDQLIGNNKYLTGNELTIADLSLLASIFTAQHYLGTSLDNFPNVNNWMTELTKELPDFDEINKFDHGDVKQYMDKTIMSIDLYIMQLSPPCRSVLMTCRELNIDVNIKTVDLSEDQHKTPEFLKLNPCHTVPTLDDNGFVMWESRAIMQYLCNQYAPDSTLYPSDPKKRALVDRWLNFDMSFLQSQREGLFTKLLTGVDPPEEKVNALKNNLKLLDTLIGDNKYLVSDNLTIADLTVLATSVTLDNLDFDIESYPNLKRWYSILSSELPYFEKINHLDKNEAKHYFDKIKAKIAAQTVNK